MKYVLSILIVLEVIIICFKLPKLLSLRKELLRLKKNTFDYIIANIHSLKKLREFDQEDKRELNELRDEYEKLLDEITTNSEKIESRQEHLVNLINLTRKNNIEL